jgi:hypothetical protein
MDREGLLRRRRALQERIRREEQRSQVEPLIRALDSAGSPYETIWADPPDFTPGAELLGRWPMTTTAVLWERVEAYRCERWDTQAERDACLASMIADLATGPAESVTVLWSNGAAPGLMLTAGVAQRHARDILRSGMEVWLCGTERPWLIECSSNGRICSSPGPGQATPQPRREGEPC